MYNKSKMTSVQIQEVIDEYKQTIPDELYRQLCDLTMKKNKEENEDEEKVYKIGYIIPDIYYCTNNEHMINDISFKTKLVKLKRKYYNEIIQNINKDGKSSTYFRGEAVIERKIKDVYSVQTGEYLDVHRTPYITSIELA